MTADMGRAWVLGNGPTLPVDELHRLEGEFTVGVNGILMSGFEPTCVFWFDDLGRHAHTKDWHAAYDASPCIKVASTSCGQDKFADIRLSRSRNGETGPGYMRIRGNTGVAAVRWCFDLGFSEVAMLGMGGSFLDGRIHFYDDIEKVSPSGSAEVRFAQSLAKLWTEYGPAAYHADDPDEWVTENQWDRIRAAAFLAPHVHQ